MKITRRGLIVRAAGIAAASQIGLVRSAKANLHGVWASHLNNTLIKNTTRAIPGMTSGVLKATVSFCYRSTQFEYSTIIKNNPNGGVNNLIDFSFLNDGSNATDSFRGVMTDNAGKSFYVISPGLNSFDGEWHWIAMSMNPANNTATFAFDGNSMPVTIISSTTSAKVNWLTPFLIGGAGVVNGKVLSAYNGDIAQLQLRAGGLVNLNDPNVVAALYNSKNEQPVRIGTQGYWGPPLNLQPQISMDGPPPMFLKNLAGYPFTWNSTNSPFFVSANSSPLTAATLDPWGFAGE